MIGWALVNVMRRAMREVEELGRLTRRRRSPLSKIPSRPPSSYRAHRDPGGRFELQLPGEWTVQPGPPLFAA